MHQFVLDASVALAWLFKDEESEISMAIHALTDDHQVVVPPHWFADVANGIRQGERTGRCQHDAAEGFVRILGLLDYAIDALAPFDQFEKVLPLARQHGLTVYDAAYLHCALSKGLPLATLDRQLAAAARFAGVKIVED